MSKEDVLCVIPARGGSKGLPRKNTLALAGQPLIAYPVRAAIESGVVGTTIVTTDDQEIADLAAAAGAEVPFIRPADIATDLATTEDTLRHALLTYEEMIGRQFEICVFLTCTDLFRQPQWLVEAVTRLQQNPELESVFAGHATHKKYWMENDDGAYERLKPWMNAYASRQVQKAIYREDTGLTSASRAWLWREGRRIGDKIDIVINDDPATDIDIHDEESFFLAEQMMLYRKKAGKFVGEGGSQ